jgi:hypothetical protein
MLRRPGVLTALVFGAFVFLGIALLLTRGLTGAGAERARVLDVLSAQARGDADGVLDRLPACRREPACEATTRDRVRELRRAGEVEILSFEPSTRFTLGRRVGTARVAWRVGGAMPLVQCVRIRREGPLSGGRVELLSISAPIATEGSCG